MEYRSGVTGGPHPGLDIFPDLSPRTKPYCGVKCSQGCTSLPRIVERGETGHNPPTVEATLAVLMLVMD